MQTTPIILLGLAILAYAFTREPNRIKLARSPHLKGRQKLFGLIAFIFALLILLNPELLALGLVVDAAFFDVLVLLISLQLQSFADRTWCRVRGVFSKMTRAMIPRISMELELVVLALAPIGNAFSAIQKAVHRISS